MAGLDNSGYCQSRRTVRVPGYFVDFLEGIGGFDPGPVAAPELE